MPLSTATTTATLPHLKVCGSGGRQLWSMTIKAWQSLGSAGSGLDKSLLYFDFGGIDNSGRALAERIFTLVSDAVRITL